MNSGLIYLMILNFAYIGILPRIFFKKDGRYNLMWFVTAAPLFFNSVVVLAQYMGWISLSLLMEPTLANDILVALLAAFSIGMISYTMGTHRVPLALWHQTNDAPVHIVTWGAYKYIRHPFYTSFLVAQLSTVLLLPSLVTITGLIASFLILNQTAKREEGRLSESAFGEEYKAYKTNSGRFFPKVG